MVDQRNTIATMSSRIAFHQLQQERFLTLNGLLDDQPLQVGTLVKLIVAR